MKEDLLRLFLQKLAIKVEGRNSKRGKPGTVWLDFRCPIAPYSSKHNFKADRSPSAGAVADTTGRASRWSCHACKSHGTILELCESLAHYEAKEGINYEKLGEEIVEAEFSGLAEVKWGQDLSGFNPKPDPLIEEAYEGFWPDAWDNQVAREYLTRRGISEATSKKIGLLYDDEKRRIMFPVRDRQGGLYGWSGRATYADAKPKVLDYEGLPKRHLILGEHTWKDSFPVIIVEGLFAYARMIELGIDEVANVGALLGSELTPEKAEIIQTHGERTYMLVDADEAGDACIFGPVKEVIPASDPEGYDTVIREEEKGAIAVLNPYVPLFLPSFPEGKNDPDDLTKEEVLEILESTPRYGFEAATWGRK